MPTSHPHVDVDIVPAESSSVMRINACMITPAYTTFVSSTISKLYNGPMRTTQMGEKSGPTFKNFHSPNRCARRRAHGHIHAPAPSHSMAASYIQDAAPRQSNIPEICKAPYMCRLCRPCDSPNPDISLRPPQCLRTDTVGFSSYSSYGSDYIRTYMRTRTTARSPT